MGLSFEMNFALAAVGMVIGLAKQLGLRLGRLLVLRIVLGAKEPQTNRTLLLSLAGKFF